MYRYVWIIWAKMDGENKKDGTPYKKPGPKPKEQEHTMQK